MSSVSKRKRQLKENAEFIGFMAANDHDDAPDGAWFAMLEQAGEEWLLLHPERGLDGNDLAHIYLSTLAAASA